MLKSSIEFLRHILEETSFIIDNSGGLDKETLEENEVLKRAIVRSLAIIGEAAKKVDKAFRDEYPSIEWTAMAKMRDKLIHHYFGVDFTCQILCMFGVPACLSSMRDMTNRLILAPQKRASRNCQGLEQFSGSD